MGNLQENMFKAIDEIVAARLNDVSFDRTETCEIVKVYKDKPGLYQVSNGSLKFDATALNANKNDYVVKQRVQVLIPNGDYQQTKTILGGYTAETPYKPSFINPLERMIVGQSIPLMPEAGEVIEWNSEKDYTSPMPDIEIPRCGFGPYTHFCLSFRLSTDISQYIGEYNFAITFEDDDGNIVLETAISSSKDLYGNPYNLTPDLPFQYYATVDSKIDLHSITCYQIHCAAQNIVGTIKLNTLNIDFGYDIENPIFATSPQLKVVIDENYDEEVGYIYTNDTIEIPISIDLYKDSRIYNTDENTPEGVKFTLNKYNVGSGWEEKDADSTFFFTITKDLLDLDNKIPNTQFQIVCELEETEIAQAELLLKNYNYDIIEGSNASVSEDTLLLSLTNDNTGAHNVYATDTHIISATQIFDIVASYKNLYKWENTDEAIWYIPIHNTMIEPIDKNNWTKDEEKGFYKKKTNSNTIQYRIKDTYFPNRTNNTIVCEVNKGVEKFKGSLTLTFGYNDNSGIDYSLNIIPRTTEAFNIGKQDNTISFEAILETKEGTRIPIDQYKDKLKWKWYYGVEDFSGENYVINNILTLSNQDLSYEITNNEKLIYGRAILEARIDNWASGNLTKTLKAYYCIPLTTIADTEKKVQPQGPDRIIYLATNTKPQYDSETSYGYTIDGVTQSGLDVSIECDNSEDINSIPKLNGNKLQPLSTNSTFNLPVWANLNDTVFIPILITTDAYAFGLVNAWDGTSVTMDEEQGTILSTFVGAGVKNDDNQFSGVLMGAVAKHASATLANELATTGLYGFKDGVLRFKFDENGDGYLAGRIEANSGSIGDWSIADEKKKLAIIEDFKNAYWWDSTGDKVQTILKDYYGLIYAAQPYILSISPSSTNIIEFRYAHHEAYYASPFSINRNGMIKAQQGCEIGYGETVSGPILKIDTSTTTSGIHGYLQEQWLFDTNINLANHHSILFLPGTKLLLQDDSTIHRITQIAYSTTNNDIQYGLGIGFNWSFRIHPNGDLTSTEKPYFSVNGQGGSLEGYWLYKNREIVVGYTGDTGGQTVKGITYDPDATTLFLWCEQWDGQNYRDVVHQLTFPK